MVPTEVGKEHQHESVEIYTQRDDHYKRRRMVTFPSPDIETLGLLVVEATLTFEVLVSI